MLGARNLDRRQEGERGVRADDLAARDEGPTQPWRNIDCVPLAGVQRPPEEVERPGIEPQAVTGRVGPLGWGEARVPRDSVLDARQHLDRADDRRGDETGDDDRSDDLQPNRRTPTSTRIALNPSRHVIFFPSS